MRTISDNPDDRPEARPARRLADLRVLASAAAGLLLLGAAGGVLIHDLARKGDVAAAVVAAVNAHERRTDPEGTEHRLRAVELDVAQIKTGVEENKTINIWNQATLYEMAVRQGVVVPAPPAKHAAVRPGVTSSTAAATARRK